MPFCGKCGRKLEIGEICNCETEKELSMAEPAEEFFSSVGKAIDEAEDVMLSEETDDDMKILPPRTPIASHIRQKIDDARHFDETRPFTLGGVSSIEEEEEPEESEEDRFAFLSRVNWKKLTVFSVGGIVLAAVLFLFGFFLFSGGKETAEGLITVTMENGTDVVITKFDGKDRSVTVKGDVAFYENNAHLTENKERVFFFADGGRSLYYLDLTGKNWHKNEPVLIDSGFTAQIYTVSPDGSRVLFQKEENGPLFAVGLNRGERITVSPKASSLIIDEDFTYLTFVGEGNTLYEVRLENGWQATFVAELPENAPVFGGEGAVYYLKDGNLYKKQGGIPYELLVEKVSELVYRDADGYSCRWDAETGIVIPENSGEEQFDGSFYYTVEGSSYYPLTDFVAEEKWEDAVTTTTPAPESIMEIADIRWELSDENRYFTVTSLSYAAVTLEYAYFDEAEGATVVNEYEGKFSAPETIVFTVLEEEGKRSLEYKLSFQKTEDGCALVISGEKDGLVVRGDYLPAEELSTSTGEPGWQQKLWDSLEGKSYPVVSKELRRYHNGSSVLVKSGVAAVGTLQKGVLPFTAADVSFGEKLQLSKMSEIGLTELLGLIENLAAAGSEEQLVAFEETWCKTAGYDLAGFFCSGGELYYYSAEDMAVSRLLLSEGEISSSITVATNLSSEGYRLQNGEAVFFRDVKIETGSLFYNGARVADGVYWDSCIWPDENDLSKFYYLCSSGDGKELWYYADTVSILAGEKVSGTPLISNGQALFLSDLAGGSGKVMLFDGKNTKELGEAGRLAAFW